MSKLGDVLSKEVYYNSNVSQSPSRRAIFRNLKKSQKFAMGGGLFWGSGGGAPSA